MTHNVFKSKTEIVSQTRQDRKIQLQRDNDSNSKNRSKKQQSDKTVRRGMRRKKLKSVKLRSTRLPCIPQKVLRVLKILRHEKFLDMVQKYFAPINGTKMNDSANRQSTNKDSLVSEA